LIYALIVNLYFKFIIIDKACLLLRL